MKLSEIKNPLVMDSARPVTVRFANGTLARVVGYTPAMGSTQPHWLVLPDGWSPGFEIAISDGELAEAGDSLEPHNPQGLTPDQVGEEEGFRLLQKNEDLEGKPGEFWSEKENKWVPAEATRWR